MKKAIKTTLRVVWGVITLPIQANYIVAQACYDKEYGFEQ